MRPAVDQVIGWGLAETNPRNFHVRGRKDRIPDKDVKVASLLGPYALFLNKIMVHNCYV